MNPRDELFMEMSLVLSTEPTVLTLVTLMLKFCEPFLNASPEPIHPLFPLYTTRVNYPKTGRLVRAISPEEASKVRGHIIVC